MIFQLYCAEWRNENDCCVGDNFLYTWWCSDNQGPIFVKIGFISFCIIPFRFVSVYFVSRFVSQFTGTLHIHRHGFRNRKGTNCKTWRWHDLWENNPRRNTYKVYLWRWTGRSIWSVTIQNDNTCVSRGCHRERGWNQQIMMLENGRLYHSMYLGIL